MATVYEVVCRNANVPDRYIGYSTKFEEMVNGVFAGEFSPQYMDFVDEHGGLSNWTFRIIKEVETREDAVAEKVRNFVSHRREAAPPLATTMLTE